MLTAAADQDLFSPDGNPEGTIYFDDHATTQPAAEVVQGMHRALTTFWANPSSTHRLGQAARQRVELAREAIAQLINAKPAELVFTSGGTESLKLAIHGVMRRRVPGALAAGGENSKPPILITSPVEHSAVRALADDLEAQGDAEVIRLTVDRDGVVDPDELKSLLEEHGKRVRLVSVQWANNETGAIQPIARLLAHVRAAGNRTLFHTDATQWVGKLPTDVQLLPVDLMTFAAHKFHGPKGIGCLYARTGVRLQPQVLGGSQERNRRGGTENVPGIVGMGIAAALAHARLAGQAATKNGSSYSAAFDPSSGTAKDPSPEQMNEHPIAVLRQRFESAVLSGVPEASVNAQNARYGRIWSVSNIAFDRLEAEAVLMNLSERGVCASGGSACSSGSLDPSPVLLAMGLPDYSAHGSIRFSFDHSLCAATVDAAVERITPAVAMMQQALPVRRA